MDFFDYQKRAELTAIYRGTIEHAEDRLAYTLLGLCSEAGEAAGKLAKAMRAGVPVDRDALLDELGDTLWYITMAADEMGVSLEEIAGRNARKLSDRQQRGVLHGSGDKR